MNSNGMLSNKMLSRATEEEKILNENLNSMLKNKNAEPSRRGRENPKMKAQLQIYLESEFKWEFQHIDTIQSNVIQYNPTLSNVLWNALNACKWDVDFVSKQCCFVLRKRNFQLRIFQSTCLIISSQSSWMGTLPSLLLSQLPNKKLSFNHQYPYNFKVLGLIMRNKHIFWIWLW